MTIFLRTIAPSEGTTSVDQNRFSDGCVIQNLSIVQFPKTSTFMSNKGTIVDVGKIATYVDRGENRKLHNP